MAEYSLRENELLAGEARVFARYLLDREALPEMTARYVAANRTLFPPGMTSSDRALLDFIRRHPWALPFLDAATGMFRPHALLRKKILVTAAILEASPRFVMDFLPQRSSPLVLMLQLTRHGMGAALKIVLGAGLLVVVRRQRT